VDLLAHAGLDVFDDRQIGRLARNETAQTNWSVYKTVNCVSRPRPLNTRLLNRVQRRWHC